jgi:preprotein translocase subunit YajC
MHFLLSIFASAGGSPTGGPSANPLGMFLPLIMIFVVMWLLIFRPQARKQKMHQQMITQTQSGDRVLTVGGIYGTVKGFKKDNTVVVLEISDNCKIELLRSSIAQNLSAEERVQTVSKK